MYRTYTPSTRLPFLRALSRQCVYSRRAKGFTIVELSVVLLVIGTILGGLITIFSATLEEKSYQATVKKLGTLKQAMVDYRRAYNRLPCPASYATYAMTEANFGVEAASTGNCTGGSPAADLGDATAAVGMVPVRTLGLPDDMALDGWGRRIRYAVAPAFVASDAFDAIAATDTTTRLTVTNNDSALAITALAAFVLVSSGENGHGARGGSTGTLINGAITNTNELLNGKCNSSGVVNVSADLDQFVQGIVNPDPDNPLNNFDDVVVYATRAELRDASE